MAKTKAKKKASKKAEKKKDSRVRCSFRVSEAKLRRFQEKAKIRGHDVDDLLAAFLRSYNTGAVSGTSLGITIAVSQDVK